MKKLVLIVFIICFAVFLASYNEAEGNNTKPTANEIPQGSQVVVVNGVSELAGEDWFKFWVNEGDQITLDVLNPGLIIFLEAQNGQTLDMLTQSDNSGGFTATYTGWHYMFTASGNNTPYSITLRNLTSNTLPVTLSSFNAANTVEGTVELKWTVQSETEMLGYNLLRNATNDEETAVNINATPIPALNTSNEHSYSFEDIDVETNTTYYYWIESIEIDNNATYHGPVQITVKPEADEEDAKLIQFTKINRNYPNPFNPQTKISYSLSGYTDTEVPVSIVVYNVRGQKVKTLFDGYQTPGADKSIDWFGKDDNGNDCSSGVYFYVLITKDTIKTSKMTLLK